MKKFFVFILIFLSVFPLTACKSGNKTLKTYSNINNYEIHIDFDVSTKTANVKQSIEYTNNTENVLKTIKFHLYPQFFEEGGTDYVVPTTKINDTYPNGINYALFNVSRVFTENRDLTFVYENEMDSILCVNLESSLMPNKKQTIEFDYSFSLPNCNHRFGYGNNTINIANFYPIACVYENNEFSTNPYSSNGDPFYSDIANYKVTININKDYIVAGSGNKIEEKIENDLKTICFEAKTIRDFALVASNKFKMINSKVDNTNINYFYINDTTPEMSLSAGIDSIKTFSNLFGKYPYQTFNIVEADFVHGGMEYPNLVMISSAISNKDDYLNVIVHETAHQWWYGVVGNDEFTYPWLDEALTEFSTVLFYDYNKNYNFNHKDMIKATRENYSLFVIVYEDVLGSLNTSMRPVNQYETEPEYTYCIYSKGVLMFESLHTLIGKNNFVKSLKLYYQTHSFKNTTPTDLITSFETVYKKDLKNFFSSWIEGKVVIK